MSTKEFLTASLLAFVLSNAVMAGQPEENFAAAYAKGDFSTAIKIVRPLAEQGDSFAQVQLGNLYAFGEGVTKDTAQAVKWWELGCEATADGMAAFSVAEAYFAGKNGVSINYTKAIKFYGIAANQGSDGAKSKLRLMYLDQAGVGQLYNKLIVINENSTENSSPSTQFYIGSLYYTGQGAPRDFNFAAKWFRSSANNGFAEAQSQLGQMYIDGKGVPQDFVLAHLWLNLAAAEGIDTAGISRDTLAARMTSEQTEEAQDLAREWMLSHSKK